MKRIIILLLSVIIVTLVLVFWSMSYHKLNDSPKETQIVSETINGFSLNDGNYFAKQENEKQINEPHIQIYDGNFVVMLYEARSYQPSGKIERNGNNIIMKSNYVNNEYIWTFRITDDNTLKFVAKESSIPNANIQWEDGLLFFLEEE